MTYLDTSLALPEELIVKICAEDGDVDTFLSLRFLSKRFHAYGTSEQECKALAGRATWLGIEFLYRKSFSWETWEPIGRNLFWRQPESEIKALYSQLKASEQPWNFLLLQALKAYENLVTCRHSIKLTGFKMRKFHHLNLGESPITALKELSDKISIAIFVRKALKEAEISVRENCGPLEQFAEELPTLSKLTLLSLNEIPCIPPEIGQLTSIEKLGFRYRCTSVPKEIGNLKMLRDLRLSRGMFIELPDHFSTLVQLETLVVRGNALNRLPVWVGNFTCLKRLEIPDNCFELFPDPITRLVQLQHLDLESNRFQALPETIGTLTSLRKLNIAKNPLTTLPESLSRLSNLKVIEVYYDKQLEELVKMRLPAVRITSPQ